MDFDDWRPIYDAICTDFGFDADADQAAAAELDDAIIPGVFNRLSFDGQSVAVAVGANLDDGELRRARHADRVVCTGDALHRLNQAAIPVSLVVTDLDSAPPLVAAHTRSGGLVAVHAHGDNTTAIADWVPRMDRSNVIGTTQHQPDGSLVNHGGFTDGDRAAFLANALHARSITLCGWAFGDESVDDVKRRKLRWAAGLLTRLEDERGERYEPLDGYRWSIESDQSNSPA